MDNKIIIQENCIQINSVFDNKTIYTIWSDDYERFRKAFKQSEDYKTEAEILRNKYTQIKQD